MLDVTVGVLDHFVSMETDEKPGHDREWLVEQRYRAVLEVLDGSPVSEVAVRYGVSRQSVYTWKARHAAAGIDGLREASRRPRTSTPQCGVQLAGLAQGDRQAEDAPAGDLTGDRRRIDSTCRTSPVGRRRRKRRPRLARRVLAFQLPSRGSVARCRGYGR
jgi:hypothetical protein